MKIGILAPSNLDKFVQTLGLDNSIFLQKISKIAEIVAQHEIIIVPEKNSVSEIFAQNYSKHRGKKVIGIVPVDDNDFGIQNLNPLPCKKMLRNLFLKN